MKIPFDIKFRPQIERGEYKLITRQGKNAEILKWDLVGDRHILAVVETKYDESPYKYWPNGHIAPGIDDNYDIFIVTPEPADMSEFEMKVNEFAEAYELAVTDCESEEYKTCNGNLQLIIDKYAGELLELAKKEVLKDLPRWRKWENGACGNGRGIPLAIVKRGLNGYELVDALGIQGEQYIMLSDLEKLPGFNE